MVCQSNNGCKALFWVWGLRHEKTNNVEQFFFPAVHFFPADGLFCVQSAFLFTQIHKLYTYRNILIAIIFFELDTNL